MADVLMLSPNLDLRAAAPLRDTLLERSGEAIVLDASEVGRLGALCLQVLLAGARDWRQQGLDFRIEAPSDAFLDTLRLFGATDALAPALTPISAMAAAPQGA